MDGATEAVEYQPSAEEAAANAAAVADAGKPTRPAWLPEKFAVMGEDGTLDLNASSAKMGESYTSLEKKLSSGGKPTEGDAPTEGEAPAAVKPETGKTAVEQAEAYYAEHGELSDDMYTLLGGIGLNKDTVDSHIASRKAASESSTSELLSTVGGPEQYAKMTEWAAGNMSESEIAAYDRMVDSGDEATVKMALESLSTRYKAAVGWAPDLVSGEGSRGGTSPAYESSAEMQRDMADPRYAKDPAFRNKVAERLRFATF